MAPQQELHKLSHCAYALTYHLVLVTKYRHRCITDAILVRFEEIARARCAGWGGELLEVNGEPDHVHLLVSLPPTLTLAGFVNNLKTTSSRLIRRDFAEALAPYYRGPGFWSRSYCVVSCGGAPLEVIRQYIAAQDSPA